jgi:hypothetical protein
MLFIIKITMSQYYVYIAYTLGENDFNDPYMIGAFSDLVTCKIFLKQHMELCDFPIYKIEKVILNTIKNNIEESFFYKMNVNDFMNPIQANTFQEIIKCYT